MENGQTFISWLQTQWPQAMNVLRNATVSDVVDVLIIAALIYKLVRFLRYSRLGVVTRGILLLLVILWLSGPYGFTLTTVYFIASRALELGFVALVIVFQPEIRRLLERMGRPDFFGVFTKRIGGQGADVIITQAVQACVQMSASSTGALIVFERQISLEDEAKTGTRVDARISAELLKNIFFDRAPLHDGAVIVRDGRIDSAGCMLPLSNHDSLSSELGMRHRAGLGMSEKSDAVVVMVSEETASISVAIDGMLKRNLDQEILENLLRSELIKEPKRRKSASKKSKGGSKIEKNVE